MPNNLHESRLFPNIRLSTENPLNTCAVKMPPIADLNQPDETNPVRYGIHTDTMNLLLLLLTHLSIPDLYIQGRVLNVDQLSNLESHPIYQFYMSRRFVRLNVGPLSFPAMTLPNYVDTNPAKTLTQIYQMFTPKSLMSETGHQVGYYAVSDLVSDFSTKQDPNEYLPILGGANEFQIGSDSESPDKLKEISFFIEESINEKNIKGALRWNSLQSARDAIINIPTFLLNSNGLTRITKGNFGTQLTSNSNQQK